jgi:hypothetical protein
VRTTLSFLWFLLLPFGGTCLAQVPAPLDENPGEEEEMEEPTCVFSGMIWEGSSIDGLGYFTEGEEKGDYVNVFLPNGGRSRKYAYYGDSPLVFYREVEVEEEDGKPVPKGLPAPKPDNDDDFDEKEEKKIIHVPITSCAFERDWKEIFMFFFVSGETEPTYQAKAINFNTTHFPAGHFWFFSRCKEPLSIQFGGDKGQLAANGQVMIKARLDNFGDLAIRVFKPKGDTLRKVYSTIWNLNSRTRTLVFLLPRPNGVSVRRIMDVVQEEKALGLRPPKDDEKKNKPPPSGPAN